MNNFALLDIAYTHYEAEISISVKTDVPCHLTLYHTTKPPLRHRTSLTQRGLTLPWGVYYCFVAWQAVEQTEPGDTFAHTFQVRDWSYCQTKWFAFRGTINLELSPSVSALFEHHHPGPDPRLFEHYIVNDDDEQAIFDNNWRAQTFTPSIAHNITFVKLLLRRFRLPGRVDVSIRNAEFGRPTGPDLCLGSFDGDTLTTDGAGEWKQITFDTQAPLDADTLYAIVIRAINGNRDNQLRWRDDMSSPQYPGGIYLVSNDSGATWLRRREIDTMFEEWGIEIQEN